MLPGFFAILGLSILYAGWGDTTVVTALFAGVAPAVIAIVAQAVVRLRSRALYSRVLVALAVVSFLALAVFAVPFPIVILCAGLAGYLEGRLRPALFECPWAPAADTSSSADVPPLIAADALHDASRSWRRAARILGIGLFLWVTPTLIVIAAFGRDSVFAEMGIFCHRIMQQSQTGTVVSNGQWRHPFPQQVPLTSNATFAQQFPTRSARCP